MMRAIYSTRLALYIHRIILASKVWPAVYSLEKVALSNKCICWIQASDTLCTMYNYTDFQVSERLHERP